MKSSFGGWGWGGGAERERGRESVCDWRGVGSFTECSIHLRGGRRGGEGVSLAGHNGRKPARGIPQAAPTHRLEVSGATLALAAAGTPTARQRYDPLRGG